MCRWLNWFGGKKGEKNKKKPAKKPAKKPTKMEHKLARMPTTTSTITSTGSSPLKKVSVPRGFAIRRYLAGREVVDEKAQAKFVERAKRAIRAKRAHDPLSWAFYPSSSEEEN